MKRALIFLVSFVYLLSLFYFVVADNDNSSNGLNNSIGQNNSNNDSNETDDDSDNEDDNDVNETEEDNNKTNDDSDGLDKETDDKIQGCKSMYWFDKETNECGQKEFCGMYMYEGLKTFKDKEKCEKQLQEKHRQRQKNQFKIHTNQSECPGNCTCTGSATKCILPDGSREMTIEAGNSGNVIVQVKGINVSTNVTLYKNEEGKVVGVFKNKTKTIILPDEAFQKVKDKLNAKVIAGKMELDENGNYQIEAKKKAKFFGAFPVLEKVQIQLNSETGEVTRTRTSWWGFLAKDTKEDSSK